MIHLKSPSEIAIMQEGGKRLKNILDQTLAFTQPGRATIELDAYAEKLIKQSGGTPSFRTVSGYQWSTCISRNTGVVHGIPKKDDIIEPGDVVGVDVGLLYRGFHTDTSWSILINDTDHQTKSEQSKKTHFLKIGKQALEKAIDQVQIGHRVGDISRAIQNTVEGAGYSVVEGLVGHGVGRKLHEDPEVPGLLTSGIKQTPLLKIGMVLAVEVIYNQGDSEVVIDTEDGWTIRTKDGTLSGLFERTVALTGNGVVVLT